MADNTLPLFGGSCKYYVYIYRDPRPRKKRQPIYVGKGTAEFKRADVHWRVARPRNPILAAIFAKIRAAKLDPIIEIVAWYDDSCDALDCERHIISKFGRRDLGAGPLCNLTDGGEGVAQLSPETRRKIGAANSIALKGRKNPEHSARLKGRKLSEEHRKKISAGNLGRTFDEATREKIRASNVGQKRSDEARKNMSLAHIGKPLPDETRTKMSEAHLLRWANRRSPELLVLEKNGLKRCYACKIAKPTSEFHRSKNMRDGRYPACKPCKNEQRIRRQ